MEELEKLVNTVVVSETHKLLRNLPPVDADDVFADVLQGKGACKRDHEINCFGRCVVIVAGVKVCTIVDTGAQISVVTKSVLEKIKLSEPFISLLSYSEGSLCGIGSGSTEILEYANLVQEMLGVELTEALPVVVGY